MARREHKPVAVDPTRALRVVLKDMTIKNRTDLSSAERQAKVTRLGGMNGIHGKSTGLVGSFGEEEGLEGHIGLEK